MFGHCIPPAILLSAYNMGIFPMGGERGLEWFEAEDRGVIPLGDEFHIPRNVKKALRQGWFEVKKNVAFREVMLGCSERPETWIDETILQSFEALHQLGVAWSVEAWDHEGLQGGLYGVRLGKAFFGESMFNRKPEAARVALCGLVERLRSEGATLLDTQWLAPHLKRFGAFEISKGSYHQRLAEALEGVRDETGRLDWEAVAAGALGDRRAEDFLE